MILKGQIHEVVKRQASWLQQAPGEVMRENAAQIKQIDGFASIITGLRRCGKSTMLRQIANRYPQSDLLFLNFEDISLTGFEADDFKRLYACIADSGAKTLMFDEIQLVSGWEIFVHQLLREGFRVYITGSNASMLSAELGTHLTGRHLSTELFPFSYTEFMAYTNAQPSPASMLQYLQQGGMPEFLAHTDRNILLSMLDDILVRDIAIRHGVRNLAPLKLLAIYLLSNIAKPFTANRLTSVAGDISTSTLLEYIAHMRDAYLIDTVGQYSTNIRTTVRNPKKVYAIDTGMARSVSLSQTDDTGRLLENYVFVTLRKKHRDHIFYYQNKGECDFVVTDLSNSPVALYQVCLQLTDENTHRELSGLRRAMADLRIAHGTLVTLDTHETLDVPEGQIDVVRATEFIP